MTKRALFVVASMASLALLLACESGGGGGTTSSSSGGSSGGSSSSGGSDDDSSCLFRTTLSGGVTATVGDENQACLYSSRSIAFAPLGAAVSVTMRVRDIEPLQTGTFPAQVDVRANKEDWNGASCTVNVESNVKEASASDASPFDRYLLKGTGTCSTPAGYRGEGGAKEPVTIAPFTFVAPTLFY